jgi:tyrosine-protein kinase Etk/Wzc
MTDTTSTPIPTRSAQPTRGHSGQQQMADDEIDLGYLLAICLDNKWLIIVITALVTLAGITYAWLETPVYRGDALLQVEQRQNNLGGLDMALLGQEQTASSTQSEILRSRMIMGQAAQQARLDLVVQPRYFPVIGEALVRRGSERPDWSQGREFVWAGMRSAWMNCGWRTCCWARR